MRCLIRVAHHHVLQSTCKANQPRKRPMNLPLRFKTESLKHGNLKLSVRDYSDSGDFDSASFKVVDCDDTADTRGIEIDVIMPHGDRSSHSSVWIHGADRVEIKDGVIWIMDDKGLPITTINTSSFGPDYYA